MSDTRAGDSAALEEELSRLRQEQATLSAEVRRSRDQQLTHLRARLWRTAIVTGLLALLAAAAVYQLRHWFF